MIKGLITALSQELELSAKEIADTIWLALQITSDSPDSQTAKDEPFQKPLTNSDSPKTPLINNDSTPPPLEREESDRQTINQPLESQKAGIYARSEQQTSKTSGLSLKVPDASSLREPLTLARALKPLMCRIASGRELVLDEAATTQQIADKGIWIPVLKPTLEPWLDLELVVDESISMQIWRHTIKELERLLKNYGVFRDVRVWGLITDAKEQIQIRRGIGAMAKNQSPRSPKELIDPSGRRLVLVASDCVSSLWRSGKVTPVLEMWAKQGSMAIVQMLPKWMWERTALGKASEVRLRGLKPGEFNQNLIAQEVSLWDELDNEREVKVPVFTLEPDRAVIWALMLSGKGSIWTSGYVFKLEEIPVENESIEAIVAKKEKLDAPNRVQGFRVTASPMARRLAGLLASAPVITLPIVRLIQETLLKDSLQVNVAEVFLGGLLKPLSEINAETNPDYVQYGFMEGVRELLLDSVPSNYVLNVIDGVSKYVAKKMGLSVADFAAVLKNEQPARNSQMAEEVGYFATATAQVLRGLGGEYAKFADSLSNKISVEDNNPPTEEMQLVQSLLSVRGQSQAVRTILENVVEKSPYLELLIELLQAIVDSTSDPQIIYPLLSQNIDKLNDQFAEEIDFWARANLPNVDKETAQAIATAIGNLSNSIQQFPLGNRGLNLDIAITGYNIGLTVFDAETYPELWANLQNNLGTAYSNRIRGERAENLEQAIACYYHSLKVYTREDFPEQWARTQNNLGAAFSDRIRGEKAENLEKVIECYQAALEVRTRDAFPENWASLQNNLGSSYRKRIKGKIVQNLGKAIACYKSALEVYNREAFPEQWATTQNNLMATNHDRLKFTHISII